METKTNTGAIFKNDKKTKDTQPDYRGKINVDGKDLEISLWLKESKQGLKYFSASLQEPYVKPNNEVTQSTPTESTINDLPF
jgi:uncharacterized protein (DUF736 family)